MFDDFMNKSIENKRTYLIPVPIPVPIPALLIVGLSLDNKKKKSSCPFGKIWNGNCV